MYFTGFADEAADGIDEQIKATLELGWSNIEARNVDKKNIHDLSDEEFDVVYGKLADAGVSVNSFGSAIANWGKQITDSKDTSLEEVARAIEETEKTRDVAAAIAHLLSEKGVLPLEELQVQIAQQKGGDSS